MGIRPSLRTHANPKSRDELEIFIAPQGATVLDFAVRALTIRALLEMRE